jgi:hypothetical protein
MFCSKEFMRERESEVLLIFREGKDANGAGGQRKSLTMVAQCALRTQYPADSSSMTPPNSKYFKIRISIPLIKGDASFSFEGFLQGQKRQGI